MGWEAATGQGCWVDIGCFFLRLDSRHVLRASPPQRSKFKKIAPNVPQPIPSSWKEPMTKVSCIQLANTIGITPTNMFLVSIFIQNHAVSTHPSPFVFCLPEKSTLLSIQMRIPVIAMILYITNVIPPKTPVGMITG